MDAYSFDIDMEGLDKNYEAMYGAYCRILNHCGSKYSNVQAVSGLMDVHALHEFMVPSAIGEDLFVTCHKCSYGANLAMAQATLPEQPKPETPVKLKPMQEVKTPGKSSVEAVSKLLNINPEQLIKTMVCMADNKPIVVLLRGDHELNLTKLSHLIGPGSVTLADAATIEKVTGGPMGFSGPVGLKNIEIIADNAILNMKNSVTGANKLDTHLINVNLERDFNFTKAADIRFATSGDKCPKCSDKLTISHGIEIGHIFKLGTRYTELLNATFLDEKGNRLPIIMGCYGIGINRIIASFIENSYDKNGIIWNESITPYEVLLSSVKAEDERIARISNMLYTQLCAKGVEVLWDDRDLSAGVKFKDADLIGIPIRIIVGTNAIDKQMVDIKLRKEDSQKSIPIAEAVSEILELLSPVSL